jgi:hypothetical protein
MRDEVIKKKLSQHIMQWEKLKNTCERWVVAQMLADARPQAWMNKTGNEGRLREGPPGVKNISFCTVL